MTGTAGPGAAPPGGPGAVIRYNLFRLLLLVAALGLGYLAGLRGFVLIAAALLVSGVASYFLLTRLRLEMAAAIGSGVGRVRRRLAARVAREDAAAEAWHAEAGGTAAGVPRERVSGPPGSR